MNRVVEKWFPVAVGLFVAAIYLAVEPLRNRPLPASFTALLSAAISVGGIAIGFLATAKSILISIDDKEIVRNLKKVDRYKSILKYIKSAIFWCFLASIASAIGLLIDLSPGSAWKLVDSLMFACWIFLAVTSALASYRVVSVFYAILDGAD